MKIKVLMENKASSERFIAEHGLSIYIETGRHKILMDAGPDRRFAENARKLGVDIADIDTVVLSHGHYDHAGGLTSFMDLNDKARIYAASGYGLPHYDENGAYIGVEPALLDNPRITALEDDLRIDEEILITGFRGKCLREAIKTFEMTEGLTGSLGKVEKHPETFAHEQYLIVSEGSKNVLFSGCSHRGIVNIASWAAEYSPAAIIGGFHLMDVKKEDYAVLNHIAEELLKVDTEYYTGHCTGTDSYVFLKERMGNRIHYAASGSEFEI